MGGKALRTQWRKLYRQDPPRAPRKLLLLGVAYRIQEQAYGGLRAGLKRQLKKLGESTAASGEIERTRVLRLKPGAKLIREWGGEAHTVIVLDKGFKWRGESWRSLSAIARSITGTRWSGPRFFGLTPPCNAGSEP
jgi:hypothetical protein